MKFNILRIIRSKIDVLYESTWENHYFRYLEYQKCGNELTDREFTGFRKYKRGNWQIPDFQMEKFEISIIQNEKNRRLFMKSLKCTIPILEIAKVANFAIPNLVNPNFDIIKDENFPTIFLNSKSLNFAFWISYFSKFLFSEYVIFQFLFLKIGNCSSNVFKR